MRSTVGKVWIETRGNIAEVGLLDVNHGKKPLTRVETVGKGAKLKKGGAFLLLTFGKGKTAEEIEIDAPVDGKLIEIEPGVAKAVAGIANIVAAPEATWVVRVELAQGAVEEDEEDDDDEDFLDEDEDGDDED